MNFLKQNKKNKSHRFKSVKRKYLRVLFIFLMCYAFVFYTGLTSAKRIVYDYAKENQKVEISGIYLTLVSRKYDPEAGIFRSDYWIDSNNKTDDLHSLTIESGTFSNVDSKQQLSTKVTQVDSNYLVVMTENVPKETKDIRQDLNIIKFDSNNEKKQLNEPIKIYTSVKQVEIGSVQSNYKGDSLKYSIHLSKEKIKEYEDEIAKKRKAIQRLKSQNVDMKIELKYKFGDELKEAKSKMNSNELSVETKLKEIEEIEKSIEEMNKKIKLLEESLSEIES